MTNKISLEKFKKIIETINNFEKETNILSDILVKHSVGFVDFGDDILSELVKMLEMIFDDEGQTICWWLWESKENRKFLWDTKRSYDVSNIEDFYYYLSRDYNKVPRVEK